MNHLLFARSIVFIKKKTQSETKNIKTNIDKSYLNAYDDITYQRSTLNLSILK